MIEIDEAMEKITLAWVEKNKVVQLWLENKIKSDFIDNGEIEDYLLCTSSEEILTLFENAKLD